MDLYNLDYGSFVGSKKGYCGFRNRLRTKKFVKLINPQKKDRILEIGCNDGNLISELSKISSNIHGIDINKNLIERLNNDKIQFMPATNLTFNDNYFDKVCSFEVIEHIPRIKKVFSEAHRVLKPKGEFIISFPLEIIRGQTALLDAIKVYKNPLYARRLHVHKLTPKKIKNLIHNVPFHVIGSRIMFIPFPSYVMILQKKL